VTTTRTAAQDRAPAASDLPAVLITRPLRIRFVSIAGTATSFYLLLSAVPLYARAAGASTGTAGLTTSALALSTVAAYLVTPRLMARYGGRLMLAAGLLAVSAVWNLAYDGGMGWARPGSGCWRCTPDTRPPSR
jgi:MFS family permease